MSHFHEALKGKEFSNAAIDIISSSLADGTSKQYRLHIDKWIQYCNRNNIPFFKASVVQGIEFLTKLYHDTNGGYSTINTARLALSLILGTVDGYTFGKQPLAQRFMRGIFKLRPSLPRYDSCFDAGCITERQGCITERQGCITERQGQKISALTRDDASEQ